MTNDPMPESEVFDMATKLESFVKTLSPKQQQLLMSIMRRASNENEDVKGYFYGSMSVSALDWNEFLGAQVQNWGYALPQYYPSWE